MFIESKKAYAIIKALEGAANKDQADNFSIRKTRDGVSVSFDMCFGFDVEADNAMAVVKRNGLEVMVSEYSYGDDRNFGYDVEIKY